MEYGGFMAKVFQEKSHTIQPGNIIVYQPLINMNPSDHTTVKTAMLKGKWLSNASGQSFTVITADQAMYKLLIICGWIVGGSFGVYMLDLGSYIC